MTNLTETTVGATTEAMTVNIAEILESGPLFVNTAEQVVFTFYTLALIVLVSMVNALLVYFVLSDVRLRTPYYVILLNLAICDLLTVSSICSPIVYMSLSGSNPYKGSALNCALHKVFSFTPMLVSWHNICVLSVERILYFYQPFYYERVVTVRAVIFLEVVLFLLAGTINVCSTVEVNSYFSISGFICLSAAKRWVWIVHTCCYYFFSVIIVASAVISLQMLVLKQRRLIAAHVPPAEVKASQTSSNLPTSDTNGSLPPAETPQNDVEPTTAGANEAETRSRQTSQAKTAIKLIASISGVFWITLFPAVVGTAILYVRVSLLDIELAITVEYRILRRFLIYFPMLSAFINPSLYLYVNKSFRYKFLQLLRRWRPANQQN